MEDDDAIMEPIHIKLRYFGKNSTYRVGLNIKVAEPPPFDFVIIPDDRDVADDADAGVEEENEDVVAALQAAASPCERAIDCCSHAHAKSLHALWPIRAPMVRLRQSERVSCRHA